MQTTAEQEEYGRYKRDERDGVERHRVLHERDVFTDFEKFHDSNLFLVACA
jgi:hypothetical protein